MKFLNFYRGSSTMVKVTADSPQAISIESYHDLLVGIKERVKTSQVQAALSVNRELIQLYWEIGRSIHQKQVVEGWGAKIVDRLAKDLKSAFPDMRGFSRTNISYMAQFAREYHDLALVQQLVGQIPWGHNVVLLQRLKSMEQRIWYIKKTIEGGWSRRVLIHWLGSSLYERQGGAITNFEMTLPSSQSDLANQTLKDPYCFDFLTLRDQFDEKELEDGLVQHVQKFLLEMGAGFAFLGRQYPLTISGKNFFMDLLFYHVKLRCFVVVELKANEFSPRDAGQMNFYLSAVDDILRQPGDNPSIGLLLCKTKDKVIAEYALRDINKPVGVAEYETQILESLPEDLKGRLPTIEEIEQEFE